MYMYINQLIVGIQLCYIVTSIRELFLLASFLFFSPFFLFISINSPFSFPTYLCCTRRNSAGRALKNFRRTAVDRCWFLVSSIFFFFRSLRLVLIFRNICYIRRRTTSIGWHIKRKQHLDESRRAIIVMYKLENAGRSTTYFRVLLAWRSA